MRDEFDDGVVGLTIEWHAGTVRLLPRPPSAGKQKSVAACAAIRLSEHVVKIGGLRGDVSIRHATLLVRALRAKGYRLLYAERLGDSTLPFGTLIVGGDFDGHYRVDLIAAEERVRRRYRTDA